MTPATDAADFNLVVTLAKTYGNLILLLLGLAPSVIIVYLYFFQANHHYFEHHLVHELAISISILQSAFITYVTYRCFGKTREEFLLYLTLAFLGFTVIYSMHGVFTRLAPEQLMVFILYGPGSRFIMACYLLTGLIYFGRKKPLVSSALRPRFWLSWLGFFAVFNVFIYYLAVSQWAYVARWTMELLALALMLICFAVIILRRLRSSLMVIYAISVLFFAQASVAFLLASAWDHLWWFAHMCFAAGFIALSYGVIQAFITTGSFDNVYSQAELMEQLHLEKQKTDGTLAELQLAYETLAISASKDSLTGIAHRREFESQGTKEIERARRSSFPLAFMVLDLDNFKKINDRFGHAIGDDVIKTCTQLVENIIRPRDIFGRIGGEEFAVCLPDTSLESAIAVAERIRQSCESAAVESREGTVTFTVSIGVAALGLDGDNYKDVLVVADDRMYLAKKQGRNRVVSMS